MSGKKLIASLDVGTTTIRCFIYDSNVHTIGSASEQVIIFKFNIFIMIFMGLANTGLVYFLSCYNIFVLLIWVSLFDKSLIIVMQLPW